MDNQIELIQNAKKYSDSVSLLCRLAEIASGGDVDCFVQIVIQDKNGEVDVFPQAVIEQTREMLKSGTPVHVIPCSKKLPIENHRFPVEDTTMLGVLGCLHLEKQTSLETAQAKLMKEFKPKRKGKIK